MLTSIAARYYIVDNCVKSLLYKGYIFNRICETKQLNKIDMYYIKKWTKSE